jgi:hypothetical protein
MLKQLVRYASTNVRGRKLWGHAMLGGFATSITWRQYEFNSEHRQQRLKEIQGYEWVLMLSWLSALLLLGATWWAAFKLLCCIVELIQYVPRSLP